MPNQYRHLSAHERDCLSVLKGQGHSLRHIARTLGRDVGTISRELRRNRSSSRYQFYLAHAAQKRAMARWQRAVHRARLRDPWARQYIGRQLRRGWSPELIAGRMRRLRPHRTFSHEAIYQWIYAEARHLIPCLVRSYRVRRRRGYSRKLSKFFIRQRVSISKRPASANERRQIGHWEVDTMIASQGKAALQLAVDRKSRYTVLNKLAGKTGAAMRMGLNRSLARWPQAVRRTITYDNGKENVQHMLVNATLGTRSYFCTPYTSQERGTVENTAGLVRRFFPKKTCFAKISRKRVKAVERWLNHRPRRIFNFRTPAEVFRSSVALRG